jgi:hypothetical protein
VTVYLPTTHNPTADMIVGVAIAFGLLAVALAGFEVPGWLKRRANRRGG